MTAPVPNGLAPKAPNPAPWVELQQSLPSRVAMISPFVDQLMEFLKVFIGRFHGAADSVLDIEISLREALANAMIHGNRGNPVKKVHIAARCSMNGKSLSPCKMKVKALMTQHCPIRPIPSDSF